VGRQKAEKKRLYFRGFRFHSLDICTGESNVYRQLSFTRYVPPGARQFQSAHQENGSYDCYGGRNVYSKLYFLKWFNACCLHYCMSDSHLSRRRRSLLLPYVCV